MEQQNTAIILARATELRLKIRSSVNTTTTTTTTSTSAVTSRDDRFSVDENSGVVGSRRSEADASGEAEEDEEAVRLLNICDALESLENQLSSLQVWLLFLSLFSEWRLKIMLRFSLAFFRTFVFASIMLRISAACLIDVDLVDSVD